MNKIEQLKQCIAKIREKEIPQRFPEFITYDGSLSYEDDLFVFKCRNEVTKDYGMWAVIDYEWTKRLADRLRDKKVLEVYSGAGWLAKALLRYDIDLIATDEDPMESVADVEKIEASDAILKYKDSIDALLISWPPYECNSAARAIEKLDKGFPIFYIGEKDGGCTGNAEFHEMLNILEVEQIPNWPYIHDKLFVCEKK